MALPIPGAQKTAKNAASIQRKANVRAVAAQGGANAGTVSKIATEEAETAGQGALEQQKQQVGQATQEAESDTADIQLQNQKDSASAQEELARTQDSLRADIGALSRSADSRMNKNERDFALSEARREWTNSDTQRMAAAAESKSQDEWQTDQEDMIAGYDDMIQSLNRATDVRIKKLSQQLKKSEAEKDRASQSRIRAKLAALQREKDRRKKNASANKKYLGAAKVVAGTALLGVTGGASSVLIVDGASDAATADS